MYRKFSLTYSVISAAMTFAAMAVELSDRAEDYRMEPVAQAMGRVAPDSIGMEVVDGKQVIIHRLEPKETYYGLSRKYNVVVPDLIHANNNKPLKIGETVRIPTGRPAAEIAQRPPEAVEPTRGTETVAPSVQLQPHEYTTYIVGRGETLYAVSKRFQIPVESIQRANGLRGDAIREGTHLRVPKQPLPPDESVGSDGAAIRVAGIIDTSAAAREREAEFELRKNRYGIREMNEKGVGVWIEDLNQDGASMLALHKQVPVGTIVKVTNPMTNHSTFVKVVGKFVDNADTQGAIIVISKSVASVIGILDRRFQIEIAYGAPLEVSR